MFEKHLSSMLLDSDKKRLQHILDSAREAVDFSYNAAGATAIFESHPLERRFRDIHTVTQQLQGQLRHFETVGAWMMGVDTDLSFV